jgi:hypothetical protein
VANNLAYYGTATITVVKCYGTEVQLITLLAFSGAVIKQSL